jgi:hypothetical protein
MKSRTTSIRKLTLLAVASAALLPYFARPVHATFPGTKGQIVFVQGDPNAGVPGQLVFISNPDGSNQQQVPLGDPIEFATGVVWSPDGTKLLIDHTIRFDQAQVSAVSRSGLPLSASTARTTLFSQFLMVQMV